MATIVPERIDVGGNL